MECPWQTDNADTVQLFGLAKYLLMGSNALGNNHVWQVSNHVIHIILQSTKDD